MRLCIADPFTLLVDRDVACVRAEDASGHFAILPHHADFLTALEVSVISWRDPDGAPGYCAVRNGILTVIGGQQVSVATREGLVGDDLDTLESEVLTRYRKQHEMEQVGRISAARLRMQAIRHMVEALQGGPREIGL